MNERVSRTVMRIRKILDKLARVELNSTGAISITMEVPADSVSFLATFNGYREKERKRISAFTIGVYNGDNKVHVARVWMIGKTIYISRAIRIGDLADCLKEMAGKGECKDYREEEVGRVRFRARWMEYDVMVNKGLNTLIAYIWVRL